MKKLLLLIIGIVIALFLASCGKQMSAGQGAASNSSGATAATVTYSETETGTEETDSTGDVKAILTMLGEPVNYAFIGDDVLYFDGVEQSNINPKPCGYHCFTDGNHAINYAIDGSIDSTADIDPDMALMYGDYWVKVIDPDTAYALGAKYKYYTEIYQGKNLLSAWYLNEWQATEMYSTVSGDVFIRDSVGNLHSPTGITGINHANDVLIYDFDATSKTASIETDRSISASWSFNYFNQAKEWQYLDGVWYSQNGYEISDDLIENANAMWEWNLSENQWGIDQPTLIAAGVWNSVLYWVECNTGDIYGFDPSSDTIEQFASIYAGDGTRASGYALAQTLQPFMVDGTLYFSLDGTINAFDMSTRFFSPYFAGDGRFWRW